MGRAATRSRLPRHLPRIFNAHCQTLPLVTLSSYIPFRCCQVVKPRPLLAQLHRSSCPLRDATLAYIRRLVLLSAPSVLSACVSRVRVLGRTLHSVSHLLAPALAGNSVSCNRVSSSSDRRHWELCLLQLAHFG